MKKSPKNFVILCLLNFILWTIIALITVPTIVGYTNPTDASAAMALGFAAGLFGIGGGIAVGLTGSAAISALTEKPEAFVKSFLIVTLAEGVAIYGLLLGIMVFSGLG